MSLGFSLHYTVVPYSTYYPPTPFFCQKLCRRVFIYSICPPFTAGLLPVLYTATTTAGK